MTAAMIERGTVLRGHLDSSPSDPADSNPAKDRNPNVAAKAIVVSEVPDGTSTKWPLRPRPCGAPPKASLAKMIAMRATITTSETPSNASSDRVVNRIPREARIQITAHAASAIGSQLGDEAMPV